MSARFIAILIVVLGAAVAIGVITGRNQPPTAAATAPSPQPTSLPTVAPNTVQILPDSSTDAGAKYRPATLTVTVGQKVTWVNLDSQSHAVIADSGAFTTPVMGPGESASWVAGKPGTFPFSDYLHPEMHGSIVVKP